MPSILSNYQTESCRVPSLEEAQGQFNHQNRVDLSFRKAVQKVFDDFNKASDGGYKALSAASQGYGGGLAQARKALVDSLPNLSACVIFEDRFTDVRNQEVLQNNINRAHITAVQLLYREMEQLPKRASITDFEKLASLNPEETLSAADTPAISEKIKTCLKHLSLRDQMIDVRMNHLDFPAGYIDNAPFNTQRSEIASQLHSSIQNDFLDQASTTLYLLEVCTKKYSAYTQKMTTTQSDDMDHSLQQQELDVVLADSNRLRENFSTVLEEIKRSSNGGNFSSESQKTALAFFAKEAASIQSLCDELTNCLLYDIDVAPDDQTRSQYASEALSAAVLFGKAVGNLKQYNEKFPGILPDSQHASVEPLSRKTAALKIDTDSADKATSTSAKTEQLSDRQQAQTSDYDSDDSDKPDLSLISGKSSKSSKSTKTPDEKATSLLKQHPLEILDQLEKDTKHKLLPENVLMICHHEMEKAELLLDKINRLVKREGLSGEKRSELEQLKTNTQEKIDRASSLDKMDLYKNYAVPQARHWEELMTGGHIDSCSAPMRLQTGDNEVLIRIAINPKPTYDGKQPKPAYLHMHFNTEKFGSLPESNKASKVISYIKQCLKQDNNSGNITMHLKSHAVKNLGRQWVQEQKALGNYEAVVERSTVSPDSQLLKGVLKLAQKGKKIAPDSHT